KDYANVGVGILGSDEKTAKKYLDDWLETQPGLKKGSKIVVNAGCIPVGGFLEKMTLNGLIIVGDAAHQVNPIHGGGMGIAMEAADVASEIIAEAIEKKDFSDKFLSKYTSRWYEKRGNKLKDILKKRKMLEEVSDKDFEVLVNSLNGEDVLKIAHGDLIDSAKTITKKLIKNPKLVTLMVKYLK
ncbi:NAD(P)/FAD-dependent oxidoreductase, partial [Candidatus Micrarchaeota archaeon]|nr:NAD(P)/FAD-dependent oxidoreductase [Candidatus Micrarchaeota archaeon]